MYSKEPPALWHCRLGTVCDSGIPCQRAASGPGYSPSNGAAVNVPEKAAEDGLSA